MGTRRVVDKIKDIIMKVRALDTTEARSIGMHVHGRIKKKKSAFLVRRQHALLGFPLIDICRWKDPRHSDCLHGKCLESPGSVRRGELSGRIVTLMERPMERPHHSNCMLGSV